MAFEINSTSPPAGSAPTGESYSWDEPKPTGLDGEGRPCGAVGRPSVTIRFNRLSLTGWNWYLAFTGSAEYAELTSVQLWNPYKSGGAGWEVFSTNAIMHKPKTTGWKYGAFQNVEIKFTGLE